MSDPIHTSGPPGIMNTDQGSQFTSFAWTDRLKRAKTRISMDGKGRYPDTPRACSRTCGVHALDLSRPQRSPKHECEHLHACETGSQARAGVGRWITVCTHLRPPAAQGGQPPAVVDFTAIETDQQVQAVA